MKKNKDYVSRKKPSFMNNLKVRKSNRDHVMDSYEGNPRGDSADLLLLEQREEDEQPRTLQIPDFDGGQHVDYDSDDLDDTMEAEFVEKERTPRTDLNKAEKLAGFFVPKAGKKLQTNRYMFYTCFMVVFLFAGLIVYLARFTIYEAPRVITSPYNKRTAALAENITRGKIKSANDKVLAETEKDDNGEEYRNYPYEDVFAHVVGYASHGKGGIESAYNYDLLTSHEKLTDQFKKGITGRKNVGDTICTTLDTRLQSRAYEALGDYDGAIIAIEPSTGKVRAMVSKPDFNPNTLDEDWEDINTEDGSSLLNRAIYGIYPPGSTYKTLTALEYLEENPASWQEYKYNCKGETVVNSVRIKCYGETEHGKESLAEAYAHSCNTAFVTLGCKLNMKKFLALNDRFLFGRDIEFDLPVKKSRLGLNPKSKKSDIPQAVIGQGDTLMTPFHNAMIMCAIANDGVLMRPTLVDHIENADGDMVFRNKIQKMKTLCDDSDAKIMKKLMRQVVKDGTGHALMNDKYSVAGKTGTAETGKGEDHSWFVGFSNVKNPDLVVCVLVEHGGAGSEVAAPMADEIFDSYYENEMDKQYRMDEESSKEK